MNLSYINMEICDILELFKMAPRIGNERDIPEGTRYIQLSDTLARKIENKLNDCLDCIEQNN